MSVIPESHRDIIGSGGLGFVATIGPHGEPQNNPVWIVPDGEHLLFSLHKSRQKYRNLQRDPRISIAMTDMDNRRRYLEIRGTVLSIDEDADNAFIDSIAQRFVGTQRYEFDRPGTERVVVRVLPQHTSQMG